MELLQVSATLYLPIFSSACSCPKFKNFVKYTNQHMARSGCRVKNHAPHHSIIETPSPSG